MGRPNRPPSGLMTQHLVDPKLTGSTMQDRSCRMLVSLSASLPEILI